MRRLLVCWFFVGLTALMAPVSAAPAVGEEAANGPATVAVQRVSVPYPAVRDEVAMILVGTALIGLAAALRRSA
jgi:hypothetical protein